MTVETDTLKNSRESPSKNKRKRVSHSRSRSSSTGSSSSGSSSSSSASSRSTSSSSSSSTSSSSRSTSPDSSPEKKPTTKSTNNKKANDRSPTDDKPISSSNNQARRSASPARRQEKEKEATKIYIGKLSLNVNKDHLAEIFGTFGEIKEIDLPAHRIHSRLHRGFAHIEYVTPQGAEQACKYMEGGQVDGQEIVCVLVHGASSHVWNDRSRRDPPSPYRKGRRSPPPSSSSRYYSNQRRGGDRDRDRNRGRYNDRRGYSPPPRNYRRGQSPPPFSRRAGVSSGNAAESPKKKERRYSRSSSSESK